MNKKRRVGIEDVAKRAGVSITTVSRVINHVPTVSPRNQAKVEEAIAALNYEPDANAQRLARGLNNAIGFVMPGYPGIFYSFYAVELIRGVGHACETLRLDLVFHITNGFNDLNTSSVGGIVFADIIENRRQIEAASAAGIPCMVINNIVSDMMINYIGIDNVAGGRTAADYLIQLGHKRIAIITGNLQTQSGQHRLEGFRGRILDSFGELSDEMCQEGDYSRRSARIATEKLLELPNPPTAIFASSDDMALEVLAVLNERGIKVPDDMSVIGFDDNPDSLYGQVSLTTIHQPLFQMAEEAVRMLNAIVLQKEKQPFQKVLIPELVVRDSCAAPKRI
ncbi:MAG TPA: LacI family DNA-binding transcriptional regulator [Candidatus Omnitrophota bacterium]|nr:LacI family DNA-binding transcriptional regulator [Candidatus Omnitrophota bacterium]HSA31363.1 LacI family DNA-binding transcriptional regulator [Candidatus Omnitrophota bacterium]